MNDDPSLFDLEPRSPISHGDRVTFHPLWGGKVTGRVIEVQDSIDGYPNAVIQDAEGETYTVPTARCERVEGA